MTNSSSSEPVDLSDPSISPHRLHELAQTHPEFWDEILAHPNVYPGLTDWIRDRQAELAATGNAEPVEESDAVAQAAVDEAAAQEAERAADFTAQSVEDEQADDAVTPDAETTWAFPSGAGYEPRTGSTAAGVSSERDTDAETSDGTEQSAQDHMTWGWSQPAGQPSTQPQADAGQYAQQPSPQQPQPGYQHVGYGQAHAQQQQPAQPQQFGQQQQQHQAAQQRGASRIDLDSARTWGLFVAGGAAFLSLFGFIFTPTLDTTMPFASHLTAGGWIIVLLFIATVALSLLQLLKPSPWMSFFFVAVSLGAGFVMIGRALTLIGFFTMRYTGFSVLWLLFMSLVLLAGTLIYLAPKSSDANPAAPSTRQQGYPSQQYGPQSGYGHQHPGYPNYPGGPQQFGGYSPGGPQQ